MTAISRVTPEARVIECAREYANWRDMANRVGTRVRVDRCTMDSGRLFDSLALAEAHLLTAVKRLPQCLSDDDVTTVIPVKGK